ncbi:MAG TPA: hypothetical protein VE998_00250 [Terriglobales bacterium]|nr:hypothetical protein [Terriglobales bacterium]
MPKKKPRAFRASKVVKEMAREQIGSPPPTRAVPEKKTKPPRHKPTLNDLLSEQ